MPYTASEKELMANLKKQYGAKKALSVYEAMANEYEKHGKTFSAKTKKEIDARRKRGRANKK